MTANYETPVVAEVADLGPRTASAATRFNSIQRLSSTGHVHEEIQTEATRSTSSGFSP